ncbi:PREDICTED: titin-like, partial [Vollenhovia emeryi]|uniref:titin-like n=1 Tax=Vollenhovia emeryi TaxID=411798 RepID=UPI0005F39660
MTESVKPETKRIIPEQIPFESIQQIESIPHESERLFLPDEKVPSTTADVSFRVSEGVEVIQVTTTEKETKEIVKGLEESTKQTAEQSMLGMPVVEQSQVVTSSTTEEMTEPVKPELKRIIPEQIPFESIQQIESISHESERLLVSDKETTTATAEISFRVSEGVEVIQVTTTEKETKEVVKNLEDTTKQIAEQSILSMPVAQKSHVIASSSSEEMMEYVKPDVRKITPEQIPFEGIQQMESIPHESERNLIAEKAPVSATAEVSFRTSEGVEVIQITATEKEAKEVVKGLAKEVSVQPDIIERRVALKTEILPEGVVSEFSVPKPESKTAHGVKDERQGVIVTELQYVTEIESNLPESVIPVVPKLASTSIEADYLEKLLETTEASEQEHHITITQHTTIHETKQPTNESDTEETEEYTTKFRRGSKEDETAVIKTKKTTIRKKRPKTKSEEENIVVIEEEIEDIKSQMLPIPKKELLQIEEVTGITGLEEIAPTKIEEQEEIIQGEALQTKMDKLPSTDTPSPIEKVEEAIQSKLPSKFAKPSEEEKIKEQVTVTEEIIEGKKPKKITKKKIIKRTGKKQQEETTIEENGQLPVTTITEGPVEEIVEETILPLP